MEAVKHNSYLEDMCSVRWIKDCWFVHLISKGLGNTWLEMVHACAQEMEMLVYWEIHVSNNAVVCVNCEPRSLLWCYVIQILGVKY